MPQLWVQIVHEVDFSFIWIRGIHIIKIFLSFILSYICWIVVTGVSDYFVMIFTRICYIVCSICHIHIWYCNNHVSICNSHTSICKVCTLSIAHSMRHITSIVLFWADYGANSQEISDLKSKQDFVNQFSMSHWEKNYRTYQYMSKEYNVRWHFLWLKITLDYYIFWSLSPTQEALSWYVLSNDIFV